MNISAFAATGEAEIIASSQAAELTIFGLFLAADPIVKFVMFLLVGASIWCWAIMFDKITKFRRQVRNASQFDEQFWSGGSLDDLYNKTGDNADSAQAQVFVAAMREWRRANVKGLTRALQGDLKHSLLARIERTMGLTITREMERLESGMSVLASIGSVSPFVGLLGTVWGIMNSFQSIAESKNTSLAVVAPGIAEALFATALGLAAAIPAVVAYNKFSADLDKIGSALDVFAQEFSTLLGRQLDEGNK
jgi:biopolymer transport protein TolQ